MHTLNRRRHFIGTLRDYLVPPYYLAFFPFLTLTIMPNV